MGKPKYFEGMKNLLIVALFFSTMLLLYFIWEDPMIESFRLTENKGENEQAEIPLIRDVIQPERVIVHFGTGVYTTLNYDDMEAWNQCILTINQLAQEETLTVAEITRQQYDKIMEFRSVCFEFLYDIPFSPFCSQYNISQTQKFDQIDSFSLIGYSSGSPESLFIQDRKNGKYYRLVSEGNSSLLEALITRIEAGDFISYYPIGTIVGTDNPTILPLSIQAGME
ncbi:MAG: two-component system activity regulator YycH, partial [Eubacteriales bacterium]|nr:two-component system activity regulator YycH [Eubacteriales bacterium]